MSGQRPRVVDACASRLRSREPWWATTSRGGFVVCMGWVIILCRQGGEVVGSVDVPQRRRSDVYVGAVIRVQHASVGNPKRKV
jgi:hypothetical protein